MIRNTKYSAVIVLLFLSFDVNAQTTQSTQPSETKSQLIFEKSVEKIHFYRTRVWGQGPVIPEYAAVVEFQEKGWHEPVNCYGAGTELKIQKSSDLRFPSEVYTLNYDNKWKKKVQDSSFWASMSEKQKQYILTSGTGGYSDDYSSKSVEGYLLREATVFAVSENDAHLMANVLIEVLNKRNNENLARAKNKAEQYTKMIETKKNQIAQLNAELKKAKAEISTLQAIFHYTNPESAFAEFVEMDKLVRIIGIDVTGANARMAAIREIEQKDGGKNQPLLDQKRIDLNIEMTGLLARKNAAEDDRDQAKKYYDSLKQVEATESSIKEETDNLNEYTRKMMILKETLADLPSNMRPVVVVDNKAVIHPLYPPEP